MTNTTETNGTRTPKIDLALLPVYVSPLVAARLGIPAPGSVSTPDASAPADYSDGYGGTYAKGE